MLDFTGRMEALVADIVRRLPAFEHIDPDRLLLAVSRARRGGLSGTFARIYPLRFEGGVSRWTRRAGRTLQTYEMPPVLHGGREILYIITFLLPRFQNLPFEAKLATVIHELYHVGPACDGDIRRLPGKNFAHGPSRELYDQRMAALAAEYLRRGADRRLTEFLEHDFRTLERRYGGVTGLRVSPPVPRLVATEPAPRRPRARAEPPAPPGGHGRSPAPRPEPPSEPPARQLSLPFPPASAGRRGQSRPARRSFSPGSPRTATRRHLR